MEKNEHQMFFSEVKKIIFWNQILSRLGEGEKKMDTNFLNNKAILMFQNCQSCEVISIFEF